MRHDLLDGPCFIARNYSKQVCASYAISPPTKGPGNLGTAAICLCYLHPVQGYARCFTLILGHGSLLFRVSEGSSRGSPGSGCRPMTSPIHGLTMVDPGCAEDPSGLVTHLVCLLQGVWACNARPVCGALIDSTSTLSRSPIVELAQGQTITTYICGAFRPICAAHNAWYCGQSFASCLPRGQRRGRLPLARFPPSATALLCHAGLVPPCTA